MILVLKATGNSLWLIKTKRIKATLEVKIQPKVFFVIYQQCVWPGRFLLKLDGC